LTYNELDRLVTRLAYQLVDLGVAKDKLVPLCFEKSMWATVAMLVITKAGGTFTFLGPSLPEQRLQAIIQQVSASLILSRLSNNVQTVSAESSSKLSDDGTQQRCTGPSLDSTTYIVFPSGSTGMPKGVSIDQGSSASAVRHQVKGFGFTNKLKLYGFSTDSVNGAILNTFTVFAAGECLCVPTEDDHKITWLEA
ncbi:hypothetical protein EDB80DRAFT_563658, partial [Ilyonectria destructans]